MSTPHPRSPTSNIHKVEFDPKREMIAGPPTPVTHGSWQAQFPDISPDGQWLAFASSGEQEDVFVSRTDGSSLRQLTDDEYRDRVPRWSPDGKRLGFDSNRSGAFQIWTIAPDGSDLRQLTRLANRGTVYFSVWSPDGKCLYLSIPTGAMAAFASGRTYVLPVRRGSMLPDLPAGGFRSEADVAAVPGIQVIEYGDVAPGPTPSVYAFSRETVQRNLYRIPLP